MSRRFIAQKAYLCSYSDDSWVPQVLIDGDRGQDPTPGPRDNTSRLTFFYSFYFQHCKTPFQLTYKTQYWNWLCIALWLIIQGHFSQFSENSHQQLWLSGQLHVHKLQKCNLVPHHHNHKKAQRERQVRQAIYNFIWFPYHSKHYLLKKIINLIWQYVDSMKFEFPSRLFSHCFLA